MEHDFLKQLKDAGYDCAYAFATKEEVEAGAACGQLSLVEKEETPAE
jgi:adenine C2-methylase RlmN of 23S rRNA A2503 and tRNA A37